jgi:hypothetical protein
VKNRINAAGVDIHERNTHRSFVWELLKAFRSQNRRMTSALPPRLTRGHIGS